MYNYKKIGVMVMNIDKEKDKIYILGHDNPDVDSIVSGFLLERLLIRKGFNVQFVIPEENINQESYDICKAYGLDAYRYVSKIDLSNPSYKFILVDHNEREVNGEIVAIVDHHPSFNEKKCENYFNEVSSSTSCIICQNNENEFSRDELQLAFLAAFVDTASFHSTKGREKDREWIFKWCEKLDIDYNRLYKAGLCLTVLDDLEKVSFNGLKKYDFDGCVVYSSYIQIENTESERKNVNDIIDYLKEYVFLNDLEVFVFIVHNSC